MHLVNMTDKRVHTRARGSSTHSLTPSV